MKNLISLYANRSRPSLIELSVSAPLQGKYQLSSSNDAPNKIKPVIAILDTGLYPHKDLEGRIIASKNFTNSWTAEDKQGHGTHCAGIAAAGGEFVGVCPDAHLINAKVLNDDGQGRSEWIVAGIKWAIKQGAHILSMSLGSREPSYDILEALQEAIDNGIVVVCAAGNSGEASEGQSSIGWPAKMPDAICIGSVTEKRLRSRFSSTGPELDFMALGDQVYSTYLNDRYARLSGTSMACPMVSGLLASRMIEMNRKFRHQSEAVEWLVGMTKDLEEPGFDDKTGWGSVYSEEANP